MYQELSKRIRMKAKNLLTIILISSLSLMFFSCDKDSGENETLISSNNDKKSHKHGQNCMSCHRSGGSGDGWFVVAGSVYDAALDVANPNGTIRLYDGPVDSGMLIKTVEVDGKGNFYTTENIDFASGLYTSVTSANGNVKIMNSPITDGACNSCHGNGVDRIWVD